MKRDVTATIELVCPVYLPNVVEPDMRTSVKTHYLTVDQWNEIAMKLIEFARTKHEAEKA